MAMSKLIGLISFSFVFVIVLYAMYEMHISQNYDSLPQLIISAFAFASVYAAFYLTMAKVEHVEAEKTLREKELSSLAKNSASKEEIANKQNEISQLMQKALEILGDSSQSF